MGHSRDILAHRHDDAHGTQQHIRHVLRVAAIHEIGLLRPLSFSNAMKMDLDTRPKDSGSWLVLLRPPSVGYGKVPASEGLPRSGWQRSVMLRVAVLGPNAAVQRRYCPRNLYETPTLKPLGVSP